MPFNAMIKLIYQITMDATKCPESYVSSGLGVAMATSL